MYPLIFSAGASPCPTLWDIIFHSVRSTCFFSLFTLNFPLFSDRQLQGLSLRYNIKFNLCFRPIFEGAVIFPKKMTEGVYSKLDVICFTPSVSLRSTAPSKRERNFFANCL